MFSKKEKPTKGNEDIKLPFVFHLVNDKNDYEKKIFHEDPPVFKILSIDPAIKNYCVRIETRPRPDTVGGSITSSLYQKINLNPETTYKTNNYCILYNNLNNFLESHEELWKDVDWVLIEHQLPKNINSTRIMQHTISFFMTKLKNSLYMPIIVEVDPKIKTKLLGAPSCLNEKGYKKWTVEKAEDVLKKRNDEFSLKILRKNKKKDDFADTVAQIEATAIKMKWPLTEEIYLVKI